MFSTDPQPNSSPTTQTLSPAKKNIKKHRQIISTYLKCKHCSETTCRVYLEDTRYRTHCATCGYTGYLKELNT